MATLPAVFETPMGRVGAQLTVANSGDEDRAANGEIDPGAVRSVTLDNVLVDTGATFLSLPANVIARLGLRTRRTLTIATATGPATARLLGTVNLTVMGRSGAFDVLELPTGTTPLLGVIPMEALGVEPDLQNQRLRLLPEGPTDTYVTA